jgi:hypothetical protein
LKGGVEATPSTDVIPGGSKPVGIGHHTIVQGTKMEGVGLELQEMNTITGIKGNAVRFEITLRVSQPGKVRSGQREEVVELIITTVEKSLEDRLAKWGTPVETQK